MDEPKTEAQRRREVGASSLAKYFCIIVGIEPVDRDDGSPHWWLFMKETEAIYDDLMKRFPPPKYDSGSQ